MAEKVEKTEVVKTPVVHTNHTYQGNQRKWWLVGALGLGVVLAFMLGMLVAGAKYMNYSRYGAPSFDGDRDERAGMMMEGRRGGMMRGGVGGYDASTMAHGVVTAVSDSEMTVVGNGTSKKITLNSSTTYGTNKPKVNDSVMVRGTTSGETFTATSVQVVNK